jgi:hypothetical protein
MVCQRRRRAPLAALLTLAATALALAPSAALAAPPANDDFADGQAVTIPARVTGTTVDATLQAGEPATSSESVGRSVWYELTPTATEQVRIDTCGSHPQMQLAVYTGSNVASLNEVGKSAYDCVGGARVYFTAVLGTTYHVRVSGSVDSPGEVVLNVAQPQAPANDDFADAQPLTLPAQLASTNVDATTQAGEPAVPGSPSGHSVWYRVTATTAGPLFISTCDDADNPLVTVYTGSGLGHLTEVGQPSTLCGPRGIVTVDTVPGTTYYLLVRGYADLSDAFTLTVEDRGGSPPPGPIVPPPPDPTCPFQFAAPGSVTYEGTWSGGGEVCLTVKPDFSGLSWFSLTRPPTGCDLPWAVERFEPALAIAGQRFAATTPSAVLSGRFTSSHEAHGTIQLLRPTASGTCRSAVLTWKATTTSATPFPDPDLTAPRLALSGATVQRPLRRNALLVGARCPNEACTASASTTIGGRKLVARSRKLRAGHSTALRLVLTTRARRSIRARSGLHARVTVVARDAAGNRRTGHRMITLRR